MNVRAASIVRDYVTLSEFVEPVLPEFVFDQGTDAAAVGELPSRTFLDDLNK
jgi:hypothetical protein